MLGVSNVKALVAEPSVICAQLAVGKVTATKVSKMVKMDAVKIVSLIFIKISVEWLNINKKRISVT